MLSYLYLGASLSLYGSVKLDTVLNYAILIFHNKSVMNPLARFSGSAPARKEPRDVYLYGGAYP